MAKDDPGISFAQRQTLFHITGDRFWLENENITKEMAGKQFALVKGKKKVTKKAEQPTKLDWDKLDSKGKSAALQGDGVNIQVLPPKGNQGTPWLTSEGRCQKFMYDLRDMLKKDIQGEIKANEDYTNRSAMMNGFNLPIWASAVQHIANEEAGHKAILEIIVDVITEKCGE